MELKQLKLAWKTGGMISENSTNQGKKMNSFKFVVLKQFFEFIAMNSLVRTIGC